jgi:hypothetical protein
MCRIHLIAALDKAARALIVTEDVACWDDTPHVCVGGMQWCHVASRRFLGTRWASDGAVAMCAGRHTLYTNHPDSWARTLMRRMGATTYEAFLERAHGPHPDLIAEYARLIGDTEEKAA